MNRFSSNYSSNPALDYPDWSRERLSVLSHAQLNRDKLERKLAHYETTADNIIVEIKDPRNLTLPERNSLLRGIRKFSFIIYHCRLVSFSKSDLKALGMQLGLNRIDGNFCADANSISSLRDSTEGIRSRYIPYTNQPLGWHTDGYYNGADKLIRSFILHCVTPAPDGGTNQFLDPDIVFLLLNNIDEELPAALSDPESFTIPADNEQTGGNQPGRSGPVYFIDAVTGSLHMRYTARQRNITWNPDPAIRKAAIQLKEVIEGASQYTLTHKLEAGQGMICNNVLHRRTGFVNGESTRLQRLFYRARYYDRVLGT